MHTPVFERRLIGAVGTLSLMAALAAAAPADPAPGTAPAASASPSPPPEIGHVVTSDRQDEPLQSATRTTYVVTKSQMLARGDMSVADALRAIPGLDVERFGALGALANLEIRGSSSSQVLVLLDGRPLGGAQTGTLDLGEVSTSGVERIEVVEGGGSTLYGNGAIGGVINILTSHPRLDRPIVKLVAGSFDTSSVDLEARSFSIERTVAANDYSLVDGSSRSNDDFQRTAARLRGETRLGRVRADASLGISDVHLGVPGPLPYASTTTRQETTSSDARVTFAVDGAHTTTTLDLSATEQLLHFYSLAGDPNACYTSLLTQPCDDLDRETRMQVSLRHAIVASENRLLVGVDAARGTARIDAGDGAPPIHGFAETALYAQDTLGFTTGDVYAGVRAERDGGQGGAISPSLGILERFGPQWSLRGNYATAFRAPNAVDLYYPGFSNPNLQPERTQVADVTLSVDTSRGSVTFGAFTLFGQNLITPNADFTAEVNIGHASIAGLTLDARSYSYRGVTANLGITNLYRALDLTATAQRLPRRPMLSTSLALDYAAASAKQLFAAAGLVAYSMSARPPYPASNAPFDPYLNANAYSSVDAYLRLRVAPLALLSLRVQNLGNERYALVAGYPAPGRAFSVELSTR